MRVNQMYKNSSVLYLDMFICKPHKTFDTFYILNTFADTDITDVKPLSKPCRIGKRCLHIRMLFRNFNTLQILQYEHYFKAKKH